MDENETVEFKCLACDTVICLHGGETLTQQMEFILTSKCPGCGTMPVAWKLSNVYTEDGYSEPTSTYLN